MRWTQTIIVVVLALLGVGLVALSERGTGVADGAVAGQWRPLLQPDELPLQELSEITLRRGAAPAMVFVHASGDPPWRQVEPFPHPMDPFSIQQLAALALDLQVIETIEPQNLGAESSLAELGLDPPLATVDYRWPEGHRRLALGRWGIAGRAYLQLDGDPRVYVVGTPLHDRAIEMESKEWRDRRLFPSAGADSDRLELVTSEGRTVLVRTGRRWDLVEPVRTRVDSVARDELLQNLSKVRSSGFIVDQPGDLSQFGLLPPAGSLALTGTLVREEDGEIVRTPVTTGLLIGSRIGGAQDRFAMMEGGASVFRLSAESLAALFRTPVQLADPTASGVLPADVKALVIRTDGDELRLERDLERWRAPDFGLQEVPASYPEELLHELTELRATGISIQDFPREMEQGMVILIGFDERPLDTVRIARDPENGAWAFENGDRVLRVFPASMELRLRAEDYGLKGETSG